MDKRLISCFLIAILMVSYSTVAFADSLTDKQNELKGINENIENTKGEIEKVKGEQSELVNQIAEIEIDLKEKQEQLEEIENALIETQENIEITEKELDEAIEKAELHRELMDERLCAMYMCSNASYLEVIFEAKNFTDFLDRVIMIREIMSLDQEVLDEMMAIRDDIEAKKNFLEEEKLSEEAAKEDMADQKAVIEAKQEEKEVLLAELKEKQENMELDLSELEKTSKDLESTIQKLVAEREAEKKRQREEAEKKRLAELAAAQREQENNSGSNNSSDNNNNNSGDIPSRGSSSSRMIWPTSGEITSGYGLRIHPVSGKKKTHTGIDIGAPHGANVVAASGGRVKSAGYRGGYGKCVEIDHGGGLTTLYAHGSSICVSEGDNVSQGQIIMKVGSTGVSTGPHLHFEVRVNGSHVNPREHLP